MAPSTKVLAVAAVVSTLLFAGRARAADDDQVSATPAAPATARPWTVSFFTTGYVTPIPLPLAGVELSYRATERLAISAHLTTIVLALDVGLEARLFLRPDDTQHPGLYLSGGGRLMPVVMAGTQKVATLELGYEGRWPDGRTLGISAGPALMNIDSCACRPPDQAGPRWAMAGIVNLRMGKSY